MTILEFPGLTGQPRLQHFVSTRLGGTSETPYASLNVSFRVGDPAERVLANRQRLAEGVGLTLESFTAAKQVHGTHVEVVTGSRRGHGARDYDSALDATDGLVTTESGVCLLIMAADCAPVLLFDARRRAIGLAHAGWRGTVARVVQHTIQTMIETFGCAVVDIHAAIGPSIGPEDYEVGDEVVAEVKAAFPTTWDEQVRWTPQGRPYFDLWTSNRLQLIEAGIPSESIEIAGLSTYQERETFFSERREGRPTGRFAAGLMLLD